MQDSVFTKIIKGEIPSYKVYEDARTLAFVDIQPVTPGHVVVVPKVQIDFVWNLEQVDYQALMDAAQKVGKRLREVFPERKRIGMMVEGLGVKDHAHVNVFPFDTAEEFRHTPRPDIEPDHKELAAMAERLRILI
ncbi:HIT family protein [soil metagenome]